MSAPMTVSAPTITPGGSMANPAGAGGLHQFRVRFYRRMKPNAVYPLIVELHGSAGKKGSTAIPPGDAVIVRPLIPGSYVTPAELEVSPKPANNKVTFYVTPLATGRLKQARVGVYHQGRLLQEIWLPMKSASQSATRVFLGLTFLLPVVLYYMVVAHDWSRTAPPPEPAAAAKDDKGKPPEAKKDKSEALENGGADARPVEEKPKAGEVRGALAQGIVKNVPPYEDYTLKFANYVQDGYDEVHRTSKNHLCFYLGAGLLALTLLSWVWHRTRRGRRKSKAFTLPNTASELAGNPLAFNMR